MKRFVVFLVVVVLFLSIGTVSLANGETMRVIRPSVRMMSEKGTGRILKQLEFGDQVSLLHQDGDYCLVYESETGATGYVSTGYLAYTLHYLWISEQGVALSPKPGMCSWDFGYAAGGMRTNEEALVLFEDDGGYYYYIVTKTGYSGYVYRYDSAISYIISK